MAPGKRKRADYEDSDEEEPAYGKQILPVATLPDDFDEEPMDGMQYLFMVRRDALRLPHITRVENPYTLAPAPLPPSQHTAPAHISLPSDEWRDLFEMRIKNFRKNIVQPTIDVSFPAEASSRTTLPEKKERLFWWLYLIGRPEEEWNPPKVPKRKATEKRLINMGLLNPSSREPSVMRQESTQTIDEGEVERALCPDPSESLPTPSGSPEPSKPVELLVYSEVDTFVERTIPPEPRPDLLHGIDERTALHLLMYFTHWINIYLETPDHKSRLVESHGRWMFALLAKVGEHLSGDDMSLLRNLARACIALVKKSVITPPSDESSNDPFDPANYEGEKLSVRSCWIIVQTIVSVWAQRDLWMDAEEALKDLPDVQNEGTVS